MHRINRLPVRILAPQPICRNLWAHWVGLLRMSPRTRRKFYLSPFPTNGHKQKPTIAPLSIYARNTLCLLQLSIFFHPIYPTLLFRTTIVDHYNRSDQIEQYDFLTSNKRISTISPVLALVPVASAWTTTTFPTYVSFLSIFKATYSSEDFLRYYWISTILDFLLPDLNDSNGVGTSTSCFCLNYHNFLHLHLPPIDFQGTGDGNNNHLIIPLLFYYYSSHYQRLNDS